MAPTVKASESLDLKEQISLYVDIRLQEMKRAPAMWGSPHEVQATGFTLLEVYAKFTLGRDVRYLEFADFAKKTRTYKGMGNLSLDSYLEKAHPHTDPNWRSREILDLLVAFKESLSLPPESPSP